MNPSYTNPVGAANPGGGNSGNMPASANNPVGPNIAAGSGAQIPVQQIPSTSASQTIISSGPTSGDISLSGAAPSKKRNKGAIVLIVLMIIIGLVSCAYLLWQNGVFGGNNNQSQQATTLQETYNSYVNYVLWGVDSTGQPSLEAMESATPYFKSLNSSELNEYLEKASGRYASLETSYNEQKKTDDIDLNTLKTYYEDYAKIQAINQNTVLNLYLSSGQQATEQVIGASGSDVANSKLTTYIEANKEYLKQYLQMVINANAAGCIKNNELIRGCYLLPNESNTALENSYYAVSDAEAVIKTEAFWTLINLNSELYNSGGGQQTQ